MNIKDIRMLKENSSFEGKFLILSSEIRNKETKPYLSVIITDGKQNIEMKKWKTTEDLNTNKVYLLKGIANYFKGSISPVLLSCEETDEDPDRFIRKSPYSFEEIKFQFEEIIDSFEDTIYTKVAKEALENYDYFLKVPSAVSIHHNYINGNGQHALEVTRIAMDIAKTMSESRIDIDKNLVAVGAMLHDIGKMKAYGLDGAAPIMTTEGNLADHIVLGSSIIEEIFNKLDLEKGKEFQMLRHIILSHHGELEYGSPVRPAFTEALIVRMADEASAKVTAMSGALDEVSGEFSDKRNFMFDVRLFNKDYN